MRWTLTLILMGLLLAAAVTLLLIYGIKQAPSPAAATEPAATADAPQTQPTSAPAEKQIIAWVDLLRTLPGMEEAVVTDRRFPLENAAHIRMPHWVYICPRGDLWVTHPGGRNLVGIEDDPPRGVHISREQVVFVHWARVGRQFRPNPVYRDANGAMHLQQRGGADVDLDRRDYQWQYAMSLENAIVVPTERGVAVIEVAGEVKQSHRDLGENARGIPHIELTPGGFLAWVAARSPDDPMAVAHYTSGAFRELPAEGWSEPIMHLVPYTDGSVLQVIAEGEGKVKLRTVPLESLPAEAAAVRPLVDQLSDDDPLVRDEAHAALARLGPSAWSLLKNMRDDESAEAQLRIDSILASGTKPLLGRFEIVDGALLPVWRLRDGVVFLAGSGARAGGAARAGSVIIPAWISVRRGRPISVLPPALATSLSIGPVQLYAHGSEWVVSEEATGAQWFFGQELLPLTDEADRAYRRLVGIDRAGRIVLSPASLKDYAADFLVIDPAVPDPKPVLRVWSMEVAGGEVGWDGKDWPAVRRGAGYSLREEGWDSLEGELITEWRAPTTRPGRGGALRAAEGTSAQGSVYVGLQELELVKPDGSSVHQPRPAEIPKDQAACVAIGDRLYLMHRDEGLTRLRIGAGDRPFSVEARFVEDFPGVWQTRRIWVDPAGRLCIAADERLIVIFTDQQIPPAMLDMIPADELKQIKAEPK